MKSRINLVVQFYPFVYKADLKTFLLSHIPTPAPIMSEITLVRKKVSTKLVDIFLRDFFSSADGEHLALILCSFHCLGGVIFGRELQSQMKSDIETSLLM